MLKLIPNPCSLNPVLFRFLVRLVLAAAVTELLELETASGRLLVLRRRVVPLLALSALQCHNFAHFPILPYWSEPAFRHASRLPAGSSLYSTSNSCFSFVTSVFR